MEKKIVLMTRLDDGIYRSHGGGETVEVLEWNLGPRNLLKAIRALKQEIRENIAGYGSIGCGESWLRIAGEDLSIGELEFDTSLEHARRTISYITSGRLARNRAARHAEREAWENAIAEKLSTA